jgi:succinyl-diaminopimelate desuccinylase
MPGGLTTLHRSCKNVRDTVPSPADRVLATIDSLADEAVAFTSDLIRIPTVNPPGELYDDCARFIGARLEQCGFEVEYHAAEGRAEHTAAHPRVNVIGTRAGRSRRPLVHLNGHFDVVPAGAGWTKDPFAGVVENGRIYGRGACDMKAGIAAAIYAAEAVRRAGIRLTGTVEISGTVDEESGGFAGVAWLCEQQRLAASRTDFVIIPEPLNVDRICIGHRGVYWFEVITHGRIAHGSMPFLGSSAIEHMTRVLEAFYRDMTPALARRVTDMPVVPDLARHPTLNVNTIEGGQSREDIQTPCVADRCRAVFDRRFLIEEGFESAREEIGALLEHVAATSPEMSYELRDVLVVPPVLTPDDSRVISVVNRSVERVLGRSASLVASPGTYDHKHVTGIAGIRDCIAYGPGMLDLAHQPDEYCEIDDLITATKVLALSLLELAG